jgi:hypothetical protein
MGKFGRQADPQDADGIDGDALADAVLGARVFVDVTIPRTALAGRMRLLSRGERRMVTAAARKELAAKGFPVDVNAVVALGATDEWNAEIAIRTLAIAVRDPKNAGHVLGTLEDWQELDDEQIGALWARYEDLRAELDPLADSATVTEADLGAIRDAAKKKELTLLMSYGSQKLARFAITTVDPPAT